MWGVKEVNRFYFAIMISCSKAVNIVLWTSLQLSVMSGGPIHINENIGPGVYLAIVNTDFRSLFFLSRSLLLF